MPTSGSFVRIYSALAGPGHFLLLVQEKVTKEKDAPVRRRHTVNSWRFPALLDQAGRLRNSRHARDTGCASGGKSQRANIRVRNSPSARRRLPAWSATARRRTGAPETHHRVL